MYYKQETEGYSGRTRTLYHMTSSESAYDILTKGRMVPGSNGMFGGAIYFAESADACRRKARHKDVLLRADVELGVSLVCRESMKHMNSESLRQFGCDSIKAIDCVSSPEYAVYNSSQVWNIQVVDGEVPFLRSSGSYSQSSPRIVLLSPVQFGGFVSAPTFHSYGGFGPVIISRGGLGGFGGFGGFFF